MNHKEWLDNEYSEWVKALQQSTVDNFKEHPMVRRMLSLDISVDFSRLISREIFRKNIGLCLDIEKIGQTTHTIFLYHLLRLMYYGEKVLKQNPSSIVEIGGGVGQFYAVLRALGYKGKYEIYDLQEVQEFQRKYLDRVTELTGLNTDLSTFHDFEYVISLYALGEFDNELKDYYIDNVVKKCDHGLIVWNPHSGASDKINFPCKIEDEYPLTSPGNKLLTW